MISTAVFACPSADASFVLREEIEHLIRNLEQHAGQIVICIPAHKSRQYGWFDDITNPKYRVVPVTGPLDRHHYFEEAYKALELEKSRETGDVLFFDFTILGPMGDLSSLTQARQAAGLDALSAFSFYTSRDRQFERFKDKVKIFHETNWLQVSAEMAKSGTFRDALKEASRRARALPVADVDAWFTLDLEASGFRIGSYDSGIQTLSSSPQWLEADKLIRGGHPFLHRSVLMLDPLVYEMQTLRGSAIIDAIRDTTSYDSGMLWRTILANSELREAATRFEELRIIENGPIAAPTPELPARKGTPNAGKANTQIAGKRALRCALVAHVYYTDFLVEVIGHFRKLPEGSTLLVSVASAESAVLVNKMLDDAGIANRVVKQVEVNRGRDMSSLFITFREDFLSGKYDLALRLHSKKTPQVAPHISDYFRTHLSENLIPDSGFVQRVVDMFAAEPTIGMALPPTIHVGFGTLGHSWFANREGTKRIAERLGLTVQMDKDTPLAAYGTMFWFRPSAMEPMFAERWGWDEFNAEPNHIDGGLAHIMERLMGYVVQNEGYRVMQIVSKDQLVANYVKLEYKLQLLSSCFPSADIREQVKLARTHFKSDLPFAEAYWNRWTAFRTKIKRNHPKVWQFTRPILKITRSVFIDSPRLLKARLRRP